MVRGTVVGSMEKLAFFQMHFQLPVTPYQQRMKLWMPATVFIIVFHLFSEMLPFVMVFSCNPAACVSLFASGIFLDANIFSRSAQPSGVRRRWVKPVAGCVNFFFSTSQYRCVHSDMWTFSGIVFEDVPTSTRMWEHLHTLYEIVMKTNNSLTVDSQLVVVFKGHFQNHQIPQGFKRSLVTL